MHRFTAPFLATVLACAFELNAQTVYSVSAIGHVPALTVLVGTNVVRVVTPSRGDIHRFVTQPGSIHPLQQARLYAKTPGYLKAIAVDRGDAVAAGALLAEIEAPELLADVAKAKSEVAKARADGASFKAAVTKASADVAKASAEVAKANADVARANADVARAKAEVARVAADLPRVQAEAAIAALEHDRLRTAQKKAPDLVTQQSVDTARARSESAEAAVAVAKAAQVSAQAGLETAQAGVTAAQAGVAAAHAGGAAAQAGVEAAQAALGAQAGAVAVAAANLQRFETALGFTKIVAPFAGVVTARNVDLGAFIPAGSGAGSTAILTVMDFSTVRVQVPMTELEAPLVATNQPVKVSVEGLPGRVFEGRVTRLAYALDDATRTMLVEAELLNPKLELRPGMYATVKVGVEKHLGVLLVPVEALVMEKANAFVFLAVDGKARKTPVKIGFNDGKQVEIATGLTGSEKVLLVGKLVLADGQAVNAQ